MSAAVGFQLFPCPGCGEDRWTVSRRGRDWILAGGDIIQVVRCAACGLHYTNPRPPPERLGDYYPTDYAPHHDGEGVGRRSRSMRGRKDRLVGPPGRLLDVGCGSGKFLRRMAERGWTVAGIDISPAAVEAVRRSGLPALQGSLPHPEVAPRSFDLVTLRHALEHVPDPLAVLRGALEALEEGGRISIRVPNYASAELERLGEASVLLDLPRHLLHFTPATLRGLLERSGFRVLSVRTSSRLDSLRRSVPHLARRPPRGGDRLLRLKLVRSILRAFWTLRGRGSEIVASAERPRESPGA